MFLVTAVVDVVMKSLLLERLLVMARYIESYRISRYWRHIESYPYRDNYRSNEFDIPHYSRKSRCRQQTTRIAIGIINKESDGRAGSNYLHIPRREGAFSTLADRRRVCEMSVSARLGWGYVCPVHLEGSWRLAYALIRRNLLYYCCRNT